MTPIRRAEPVAGSAGRFRPGPGDWLGLAAAPVFAAMAVATAIAESGPGQVTCLGMSDGWPLSGMTLMYTLMSVFHLAPWIRLARSNTRRA